MSLRDKKADHQKLDNKSQRTGRHGKNEPEYKTNQRRADEQTPRGRPDHQKDKQPTLRSATIADMHFYRPRAGTVGSRRETFVSTGSKEKYHGKDQERQSQGTDDQQILEYENTYKMQPDLKFQEKKVKDIISAVLKENINEKEYSHNIMNRRITFICSKIMEGVKKLDMKRYKLVCHVLVGENKNATLQFSSRCLWDIRWDTFTSVTVTFGSIYATGMVFGVYAE